MTCAAVVVTYNRRELLQETLRGLFAQTTAPDVIYVIDNASTDGTGEALRPLLEADRIRYLRLATNTGGAGGFAFGLNQAARDGHDWIWTMDDDVEPRPDALQVMLSYTGISECINATKIFTANGEVQYWEQYFDFATGRLIDLKNSSFQNGKKWCGTNVACFEGMLVSRRVLEQVGAPDPEYFIYHDDTLFGIRASLVTNVIFVRDAVFDKKIYGYGAVSPMRVYYHVRNVFLLRREAFGTGFFGAPTKITKFLFFINMMYYTLAALREQPRWRILNYLVRGWRDGLRGVSGRLPTLP
jgi:rhamnopyranosyl-N-acetylglucosaminyl-diphospho-decaprenol beta-1,3/1,4-galactofuranosyltransferase